MAVNRACLGRWLDLVMGAASAIRWLKMRVWGEAAGIWVVSHEHTWYGEPLDCQDYRMRVLSWYMHRNEGALICRKVLMWALHCEAMYLFAYGMVPFKNKYLLPSSSQICLYHHLHWRIPESGSGTTASMLNLKARTLRVDSLVTKHACSSSKSSENMTEYCLDDGQINDNDWVKSFRPSLVNCFSSYSDRSHARWETLGDREMTSYELALIFATNSKLQLWYLPLSNSPLFTNSNKWTIYHRLFGGKPKPRRHSKCGV